MSQGIEYLGLGDLLDMAEAYLGRRPEVRDYGLLESALARPKTTVFGQDAYVTLHEKAAALLSSLVGNHALVDGNKRLGVMAVYVFYGLNGRSLRSASDDALYALVLDIAEGRATEVSDIAIRLQSLSGKQ